jgi:hypothetical protein
VYGWGIKYEGNLPTRNPTHGEYVTTPTFIAGLENVIVTKIFCGVHSTNNVAQSNDGRVFMWGAFTTNREAVTEEKMLYRAPLNTLYLGYADSVIVIGIAKEFIIKNRTHFCDVDFIVKMF